MIAKDDLNTDDSVEKYAVDRWYLNHLYHEYDTYIDDTIYCNDRTVTDFGTMNPDNGEINQVLKYRNYSSITDLSCARSLDKFSISNQNAKLTYKVGALTAPEVNILNNSKFFIYKV